MVVVTPIPSFQDNYIWMLQQSGTKQVTLVDPGDADAALEVLTGQSLELETILITHHHWDHTQGIEKLIEHFPNVQVFGPDNSSIGGLTHILRERDKVTACGIEFEVLEVPGHTLDHIAYSGAEKLFCGDTLFFAGCGRLFEGTAEQMHASLMKIAQLPSHTQIFCTHEYTTANLKFAMAVEPDNDSIKLSLEEVEALRAQDIPTLPTLLTEQLDVNPFIRCDKPSVKQAAEQYAGTELNSDAEVFKTIRIWKDNF